VSLARDLILEYGWNTTAYQLINPGIAHWFAARGDALVGYVRYAGVRVVAGAPVASLDRLAQVTEEFERDAARRGDRVCYFGAEERLERVTRSLPRHSAILLGAQPTWAPASLASIMARRASLRAQLNRARNKGVSVTRWPTARVMDSQDLQVVLARWLATKGLPPLHFMVEPETLSQPENRMVFVAERAGAVVGFLVASPIPVRNGWLVEQIVRAPGAPNGVAELLIASATDAMVGRASGYVTLGLAPLSRRAGDLSLPAPWWVRTVLKWVRAHGRRFYDFDGLDAFKAKFRPEQWDPVYAIGNQRPFSPRFLYAIAAAFSGGSPVLTVAKSLGKALRQEIRWAARRSAAPGA
jgi:phosphatidylglycerol lysyltransferase